MDINNSNGIRRINKYLALIISLIAIISFLGGFSASVVLKANQIEKNKCDIKEVSDKVNILEKNDLIRDERQKEIIKKLDRLIELSK